MSSPGDVNLDLLFALLDEDDGGRRYEAATAAGHIADQRPDRVRPHVGALLDELDGEPNETLGDGPWDTSVRGWLVTALRNVAGAYPEEVLPELLYAAERGPPVRREGALRALATAARTYPEWFVVRVERVEQMLDERPSLRAQSFRLLAAVASARPGAVEHFAPAARDGLSELTVRPEAARLLANVGRARPSAVRAAVPHLRDALIEVEPRDGMSVCEALFVVAKRDPDTVVPAEDCLRELLQGGHHPTTHAAAKVLAELQ